MDIKKLDLAGSWAYFDAVDERIGRLGFFLLPVSPEIERETVRGYDRDDYDAIFKSVKKLILDWDLTADGEKLECTDETKNEYLPHLLRIRVRREVKTPDEKDSELLGPAIYKHADEISNFVKN